MRLRVEWRRFRCDHCGKEKDMRDKREMKTLEYPKVVVECPYCYSRDTVVTSSPRPWRYHLCRGCGETFNSVETEYIVNK